MKVKELRIILTVDNLDEIISFYRDVAGLRTSKEWRDETGNGIILEAGKASLELIDSKDAASIDEIEVGRRIAGPVRLALLPLSIAGLEQRKIHRRRSYSIGCY